MWMRWVPADNGASRSRRPRWSTWALAGASLAAGVALLVVAIRGPEPPRTLDERIEAVASTLRCPLCQNLSVADSPSQLAAEMRRQIGRDLQAGRSPEEIRVAFANAYGEWILQAPPKRGINLFAWLAPVLLLLGGALVALVAVRGWKAARASEEEALPPGEGLSARDRALLRRAMTEEEPR